MNDKNSDVSKMKRAVSLVTEAVDLSNTTVKLRAYMLTQIKEILTAAEVGTLYKNDAPYGIDLSAITMNSDGSLSLIGQANKQNRKFKLQLVKDTSGY